MAILADLPTELICMDLKHVLPEDLENFVGTCRKTASAAQPSLEVHRDLIRRYAISKNDAFVEGSIGKLVEEVSVDRIGHYVIRLECSRLKHALTSRVDDEHTLTTLPRFLPNLRTFTLDWRNEDLSHMDREIGDAPYRAESFLTRLEAVHLRCNVLDGISGVQVDLAETFSALPSVRLLSVSKLKTGPRIHGPVKPRISNVIILDLLICRMDLTDLHDFLHGFTQLQSFSYSMSSLPWSPRERQDTTLITRGLLNSKLTLQKLVVVGQRQRVTTIGSLTDFQALKELQLSLGLLSSLDFVENGFPSLQLPDSFRILKLQDD